MLDRKDLGNRIKELRESRSMRQYELADRIGVSAPTVSNMESGRRAVTLKSLAKICEVFNVDISYFGIDTESFDEAIDLMARIEKLFSSLSESDRKDFMDYIMRIYVNSKGS